MASGIILSERAKWLVPKWIARNVAAHVELWLDERSDAGRSMKKQVAIFFSNAGDMLVDLSDASRSELEALYQAVGTGRRMAQSRGRSSWFEQESFDQFIHRFSDLLGLLASDERLLGVQLDLSWRHNFEVLQDLLAQDRYWRRTGKVPPPAGTDDQGEGRTE